MKKRIKVLVMITLNHYEEIEAEEFNEYFWLYSCKWKNNRWLKEKYSGVFDYALVDKATGKHIALGDSLKDVIQDIENLIEKYNKYYNGNIIQYTQLIEKYNGILKQWYNKGENNESRITNL